MRKAFTLIELIVVIIIVGILAAVGISQYSTTVEKSRISEATKRLGVMRQLANEYYLNNGSITGMTNDDVGVDYTCANNYFRYTIELGGTTNAYLEAWRCDSGGKTPNATRGYLILMDFIPSTGYTKTHCSYTDTQTACFGYPSWY